jgi:mannose/fructose/N-acetylgalactosamine-specific phosphotransferase system component IIC
VGCILSAVVAGLTICMPYIKGKVFPSSEGSPTQNNILKIFLKAIYYFVYSGLHVATMLLIMTMNGYVIVAMILSMTIAYFFIGGKDTDKDMPINCCASSA